MGGGKLYVAVVSYNAEKYFDYCFEPLNSLPGNIEVWVADNGSSDRTVELIRARFPRFKLIDNRRNLGFGRANNQIMSAALADGADVFLLNQDARLDAANLQTLMAASAAHPEYGVLSPLQLNGDGSALDKGFASYNRAAAAPEFAADYAAGRLHGVYESRMCNAAAWLITHETLVRVGGFDPLFWHCGEDCDYLKRLFFHGGRLGIVSEAAVWHDRGERPAYNHRSRPAEFRLILGLVDLLDINRGACYRFKVVMRSVVLLLLSMLVFNIRGFAGHLAIVVYALKNRALLRRMRERAARGEGAFLEVRDGR